MMPALLRGATIDTILSGFVCEGATPVRDALAIPASLNSQLVRRLLTTPDEVARNWSLFSFLAYRASDEVRRLAVEADNTLLDRSTWSATEIHNSPKINAYARAHAHGLLPHSLREIAAAELESAALKGFDLSFFDDTEIMSLIRQSAWCRWACSSGATPCQRSRIASRR